ncbi:MAG: hypothetical protein K0Q51_661 [Rickettsiaceae bacterium]|jgi:putative ABC transport system substrate-binding protein|nr:hypothetical protein [Rickettsiaceae bacterium]
MYKNIFYIIITLLHFTIISFNVYAVLPTVAIANYGLHSSLEDSIVGLKEELTRQGFIEGKTVNYEIKDVGFNAALIPQLITQLKSKKPSVMVAMTTPIAQYAKGKVKDIPLIYNVITDPVQAGLLQNSDIANGNLTGSSDKQDLNTLLKFARQLIPHASKVGILYATSEANDLALVDMMKEAAKQNNMEVLAIPVEQARDVPIRMQAFKNKVDFIYVGTSGPIQPALPAIAAEANKMKIPVFNVNEEAVHNKLTLASFGVSYKQVGINAGKLVAEILKGKSVSSLKPLYPTISDHNGFISRSKAESLNIKIPNNLSNVQILD